MMWPWLSLASLLCSTSPIPLTPLQRNPVFSGIVVEVMDGDLIKVKTKDAGSHVVQLWGTDAPEADQPFGAAAKKYLKQMVLNKPVVVSSYGRTGWVSVSTDDTHTKQIVVNERMVSAGYAWWQRLPDNPELRIDASTLVKAEEAARKSKLGLWSRADAVAPWEWKKRGK